MGSKPIFATYLLISASLGLSAQETGISRFTTHTDTLYQISEVVVSSFREATPNQQIGRKDIVSFPSTSVSEALQYLAGVQIKDYGGLGGQKTVNVRSLGSQHVGVYLDGVRITNAQNGTVDLGKYSLSTLEAISLFNANKTEMLMAASEYASASTLYLQTLCPDTSTFSTSYTCSSFNSHKASLNWQHSARQRQGRGKAEARNSNLKTVLDAAFTRTRGEYPFAYHSAYEDTTGTRQNADLTMLRVEGSAFYNDWQLHTYFYRSERGIPGGIVRRLSNTYTDYGREWDNNFFTQLSYKHQFGRLGLRGIVKYTNDLLHYRSDYKENIYIHLNNRYHQQDIYSAVAASFLYKDFGFSASSDLRWSDLKANLRNFNYLYRVDHKTSLAVFYSHNQLKINANALYTQIADQTPNAPIANRTQNKTFRKFTYSALASYNLGCFMLRSFYKEIFRSPTLNDLYYTQVGNRNLRPEYTQQWDLGFTYTYFPTHNELHLNFQADCYMNRIKDRIVCLPLKGSYQWSMLNYGQTRCIGVDISANTQWRNHTLLISATWQDDRNRTDRTESAYNDRIAYSPEWAASAVYSYSFKNFKTSLSHQFVGKRYWTTENEIEPPLNAYHCTDVKMGYSWAKIELEAECQDLFDVRYELVQRWPMPGRRFALTLKYTI